VHNQYIVPAEAAIASSAMRRVLRCLRAISGIEAWRYVTFHQYFDRQGERVKGAVAETIMQRELGVSPDERTARCRHS
jgi:hypothetical protein